MNFNRQHLALIVFTGESQWNIKKFLSISFSSSSFSVSLCMLFHYRTMWSRLAATGEREETSRFFVRSQSRCSEWDSLHLLKLDELLNCTLFGQQWEIKTREHDQMERMNSIHSRVSLLSVNHWDITMITHFHSGLIRAKCRPNKKKRRNFERAFVNF